MLLGLCTGDIFIHFNFGMFLVPCSFKFCFVSVPVPNYNGLLQRYICIPCSIICFLNQHRDCPFKPSHENK